MEEPRSFLPAVRRGPPEYREARLRTRPVPEEGATIDELARGQNDFHRCLNTTQRKLGRVAKDQKAMRAEQAQLRQIVDRMAHRMGVPLAPDGEGEPRRVHRSLAAISPAQAIVGVFVVFAGFQGLEAFAKWIGAWLPPTASLIWRSLASG